ncbi:MAG TPA: VWA domain-containing protein [Deltaproteobacteria bacterium]|nr:VWA domain-containing protein [Deltaproteobacteria bacterium]
MTPIRMIAAALAALAVCAPTGAAARAALDVALVMDASGSMRRTDPMTLRIPAARMFVDLLDGADRVAVVSFSTSARVLGGLRSLDAAGTAAVEEAVGKVTSSGAYTNLYKAVSAAADLLERGGGVEGGERRRRIIVLMSDGKMDVGDPKRDEALVSKLKDGLVEELKRRSIRVYTIAFTEESDMALLEEVARKTGGLFNVAPSDDVFHLVFGSIFESLKEPDMLPIEENTFFVDKAVDELTVVASKHSPETHITLVAPGGVEFTAATRDPSTRWSVARTFEMITIPDPADGTWKILFSTENNKAYIITRLGIETSLDRLNVMLGEGVPVNAWLEDAGGVVTVPEILDELDFDLHVSLPDGSTEKAELADDGGEGDVEKGDGVFSTVYRPALTGPYKFRLVAVSRTFEREKTFSFNVYEPEPAGAEAHGVAHSGGEHGAAAPDRDAPAGGHDGGHDGEGGGHGEEAPQSDEEPGADSDGGVWSGAVVKFLLINLLAAGAVLGWLNRRRLGGVREKWASLAARLAGLVGKKKE